MKLFKSLLIAPATLGLLAPITVGATEVNLNDISNYSDGEIEINSSSFANYQTSNSLLAGGEGLMDSSNGHSHDGGFSETTTASFSVDFAIGAVDGKGITNAISDGDEDLQAVYGFQIDLNTSFTGEDSLDISLDAGNGIAENTATGVVGTSLAEFDLNGGSEALTVDGVSYSFPVGDKMTVLVSECVWISY